MSFNALRRGRYAETGREYLLTTVIAGRRPVFADFQTARLFIAELHRVEAEAKGMWLAWVVMPDHFHGLFSLGEEADLAGMMNALKGRSSRTLNQHIGHKGKLWMPSFHDRALRKKDDRIAAARYLIANPLRAGLVSSIGAWLHWDSVFL